MRISTTMFWNLMFIMAATVSSCDRISVGPKMTPRLDTVIRLSWFCAETLWKERHTKLQSAFSNEEYERMCWSIDDGTLTWRGALLGVPASPCSFQAACEPKHGQHKSCSSGHLILKEQMMEMWRKCLYRCWKCATYYINYRNNKNEQVNLDLCTNATS